MLQSSLRYYYELREFIQVSSTIDGGKPGTLSYSSFFCQLKQAELAGYKATEVIAEVIKAIYQLGPVLELC